MEATFSELKQMRKSSTYSELFISEGKKVIILLILITKKIIEMMLHWQTPISCGLGSENVIFTCVWKFQCSKQCFMKMGSLSMLYGHDMSGIFKVKKDYNQMFGFNEYFSDFYVDYLLYGTLF